MDNQLLQESGESPTSDSSPLSLHTTPPSEDDSGWLIAFKKCTRSTQNPHPIYNIVSYHRLSASYYSVIIPEM